MNRKIYTYTDLRNLGQTYFWDEIKMIPQITVTADLRKSLKGKMDKDKVDGLFCESPFVKAWEMRKLYELAVPHWTSDETKFRETVILSQFIREKVEVCGDDLNKKRWLIGCRRNLRMLLSAIILLEEAEIDIENIHANGDRNIELLLEAWAYLKKNDPTIDSFRHRMKELENKKAWEPIFADLFGDANVETVIFHGFYYFTPMQERMIRLMEAAGIQPIYLFCYDEKYPYANEIWQKTYAVHNGFPEDSEWTMEKSKEVEPYGEIFEGRKVAVCNKLQMKEYANVMDFVQGVHKAKELGYFVYSSNANAANDILRDFYPEEYGDRKLLSYPIGQFVNILNKMWDEDLQDITLDEERLIECFSSGWLAIDDISGKQYLNDLVKIMPFFRDCRRINEWEERITFLRQIMDDVVAPFRHNLDYDDTVARWQEVMGNPFLNFSIFSVPEENLDVILSLIKQLLFMARELFGENKAIYIQDHVAKLDYILKEHELSNELYDEERELIKELFIKLNDPNGFKAKCFPSDISSALQLYMSGRFNEDELEMNRIGMVSPIFHIDAACVKNNSKVHICLCDINNMPGGKKSYVWPLTGAHIKDCYKRTKNPLIKNLMHIMENNYICNRYFIYAALKNDNVQLSWIKDMDDKLLQPSPYIGLISEASGIKVNVPYRGTITYDRIQATPEGSNKTADYHINNMPAYTSKEAKMDYAICPMKYVFGYVLEKSPSFETEFHQNYAINGLIAAISNLMKGKGMTINHIYDEIMKLFPAMRKVEKRQVYDYLHYQNSFTDIDYEGMSDIGKMHYTDERLKVRFPQKKVRDQALQEYGKLLTPDGRTGIDFYKTAADTTTGWNKKADLDVCLFCQHQNFCRYAEFVVDQEVLYD